MSFVSSSPNSYMSKIALFTNFLPFSPYLLAYTIFMLSVYLWLSDYVKRATKIYSVNSLSTTHLD